MERASDHDVALGFYPEKIESQHSESEETFSLSVQKIFLPDKKNPNLSAR